MIEWLSVLGIGAVIGAMVTLVGQLIHGRRLQAIAAADRAAARETVAVEQAGIVDDRARQQWWERVAWATELTLSEDSVRQTLGLNVLLALLSRIEDKGSAYDEERVVLRVIAESLLGTLRDEEEDA